MITGQNIVFISSIEWDFLWQGHQEIAIRLARAGNRVLYIENMGVRSPGLRDAGRVAARLKRWTRSRKTGGVREVAPDIYVLSPLIMPPFGRAWHRFMNRRFLLPLIGRTARQLGMKDLLLWTYLPTDTALDLIRLLRSAKSTVVYYCIADFAQLTPHTEKLLASERAIVETSDVVFAQGPELAEQCLRGNHNVHIFPFGVNLDAFPIEEREEAKSTEAGENRALPEALKNLPRPIVGYIGGMHRHVDFSMLAECARKRPQWSWVFVGAIQTDVGELNGLPNVHLLGQQMHYELVRYIRGFDVCVVPYVDSAYTATVVPTKINEYLAVGKPVVSTNLPAVSDFNRQHEVLLTTPSGSADHFIEAIEQALRLPLDASTLRRRREVAALGSWDTRLEAMSELIEDVMQLKAGALKGPDQIKEEYFDLVNKD